MIRILKNISNTSLTTNSYGKIFFIQPKGSLTIDDSQADQIATELLNRFGFLKDITPKPVITVETKAVPELNKKGRRVTRIKKVVKKGKGVSR